MNVVIVLIFGGILFVPFITADFQGGSVSAFENRYLALAPQLISEGKLSVDQKQVDEWINDNVGGRQIAQKCVGKLDDALSATHSGGVVEGKNQWLYYMLELDVQEYTNTNIPSEEELAELNMHLQTIQDTLRKKNVDFVCAMLPRKYTVYPENVPELLIRHGDRSGYQVIADYLTKNDKIYFVAPYQELVAAKAQRLTYSKAHDTAHWNNYGAWIGYQAMMQALRKVLPDIRILTESDFLIEQRQIDTEQINGFKTTEDDLYYTLIDNQAVEDHTVFSRMGFYATDRWNCSRYYRNTDCSLPKAIIVGDSYIWMFLAEHFAQSFSEMAFIHYCDLPQLNSLIDKMKPDVVLAEFLSSAIWEICEYIPSEGVSAGIIDVVESEGNYMHLDYCDNVLADEDAITVNTDNGQSVLEGWAVDPEEGLAARRVVIQVGDQFVEAAYGKRRQSVADFFKNDAYLKCGFTVSLDTEAVLSAGTITIHVVSEDGHYQYPPKIYKVKTASDAADPSTLPAIEEEDDAF